MDFNPFSLNVAVASFHLLDKSRFISPLTIKSLFLGSEHQVNAPPSLSGFRLNVEASEIYYLLCMLQFYRLLSASSTGILVVF